MQTGDCSRGQASKARNWTDLLHLHHPVSVFTWSGLTIRHFWCRWSRKAVILPWFIQLPWEAVQAPRGASLTSVPTKKCVLTLCSVRFSFPDPGFPAWKYPPVTLASLSGTPPSVAFDTDKPQTSWVTVNSYHCPTSWEDINREMELETWMQKIYHNSEPRDMNLKLSHHYQKKNR